LWNGRPEPNDLPDAAGAAIHGHANERSILPDRLYEDDRPVLARGRDRHQSEGANESIGLMPRHEAEARRRRPRKRGINRINLRASRPSDRNRSGHRQQQDAGS
jgi:hypothetical protein